MNLKPTRTSRYLKLFAVSLTLLFSSTLLAQQVKLGMTTALSGPAEALGQGVKLGVETYFNEVNENKSAGNYRFSLQALDDGYEPSKAGPNMRQLASNNDILAVIGNVGTPTAIVTVPIANETKTLLFGAFTGAGVLRNSPPDRYILNYRASYAQETSEMIKGLLSAGIKPEEIAFFTQNDGYGDAGYNGAIKALNDAGFANVSSLAHGRYTRNTTNIEDGLITVLDAEVEPKAVIMVGAYKPCAAFIELAKEDLPDVLFLNVSFVGSAALLNELAGNSENVIVTQVVPHFEENLPAVTAYRAALEKYAPDAQPGFVSLEGYLAAKLFVEGVKQVKGTLTKESIVDALLTLNGQDIGIGTNVGFADKNQASHTIWPTIIKNNQYVALDWSTL
jgi:ABC-type branched-subunit amino acid transport system substrate-binding protein